jgi:cyclopropane fatty-acyl-phospholipid synthase-like methyltransferase
MDRIATRLGFSAGARVLDLGCGWCGPALYFTERHGCRVTGVTLSAVQRDFALDWARRRGLSDRLEVRIAEVMALDLPEASFDAVTFLESIIHMPEKALLFERCRRWLRPGGSVFVQESHFDRADLREKYLRDRGYGEVDRAFGGTADLVSGSEMIALLETAGFVTDWLENVSPHYVRTLAHWLSRIDANRAEIEAISRAHYLRLRRYLMVAHQSYRAGTTVCYQIAAHRPS